MFISQLFDNDVTLSQPIGHHFVIVQAEDKMMSVRLALLVAVVVCSFAIAQCACINDCNKSGECSASNTCICNLGFLGIDCGIKASMTPLTFLNGALTMYWTIANGNFFHRVNCVLGAAPQRGWCGVLFDTARSPAMGNGQGHLFSVKSPFVATVEDMYVPGLRNTRPTVNATSIAGPNVVGFYTANAIDVSYVRPCFTTEPFRYSIPQTPGTLTNLSIAFGTTYFNQHAGGANNRVRVSIDLYSTAFPSPSANV